MSLSVIVPVYNVQDYLEKCVESIVSQTYNDIEVILVDDGSKDNSGKICDQLSRRHENIKVIHKKNGGLSSARNAGLDVANGEYISFVDSDDYVENEMYFTMIRKMEEYNVDISCCGRVLEMSGKVMKQEFTLDDEKKYEKNEAINEMMLLETIDVSACDKVYKRKIFESLRFPEGKISEDAAIIFDILNSSNGVVHVGKSFYHYVFRTGSITKTSYSESKYDVIHNLDYAKKFILCNYPQYESNLKVYCCISAAAPLLVLESDKETKRKYHKHFSDFRMFFDYGYRVAISSNRVNRNMKIRLFFVHFHMPKVYFWLQKVYQAIGKKHIGFRK